MRSLYEKIESLLENVPFEEICPGFGRCEFGIYDSVHVWLSQGVIPWDNRFMGNTAIDFEGEYIAIFYVEDPQQADAELLAADLVHEMFHAYQMRSGESRYPDDFKLLSYPQNAENHRLRFTENQLLAEAYSETGERRGALLAAFRALRRQRAKGLGDYLEQELMAEHIEGRAEYAGCRALRAINPHKFEEKMGRYLKVLRAPDQAFLDIRRTAYITGAVYGLACVDSAEEDPLQVELEKYRQRRAGQIEEFLSQNPVEKKGEYRICGYDPMNMIEYHRRILCTHFVILQKGQDRLFLNGPVLLEQKEEGSREVTGYWTLKSDNRENPAAESGIESA